MQDQTGQPNPFEVEPEARAAPRCLPVSGIRNNLIDHDDLRSVVGFQNDINGLLGLLEEPQLAWVARAEPWFPGHPRG